MQVHFQAYRSTNEPGRLRIPLPVKVLCILVLGTPGCGCQQIAQRPNPTPPVVNTASLSFTSGPVGKPVTITGTNFGAAQAMSTVKFNGTAAKLTNSRPTSITAPLSSGASASNVTATVGPQ